MIVIQQKPSRAEVNVYGEFTLADYKEFEDMVNYKVKFGGAIDLYFDLREMIDFTLDVAWRTSLLLAPMPMISSVSPC